MIKAPEYCNYAKDSLNQFPIFVFLMQLFLIFFFDIKVINLRDFSRQMAQTKNKTLPNVYFLRNSPPMLIPHPSSIRDKRVQAGKF